MRRSRLKVVVTAVTYPRPPRFIPAVLRSAAPSLVGFSWRFCSLALVAVRPLQQRRQVEWVVVDARVEVAETCVALRDGEDREVVRVHVVDLVPGDRRRDPGIG